MLFLAIENPVTMAALIGGGFSLANGLLGAAIAFGGVNLAQHRQHERDRQNDARNIRDQKRERLRQLYVQVLQRCSGQGDVVDAYVECMTLDLAERRRKPIKEPKPVAGASQTFYLELALEAGANALDERKDVTGPKLVERLMVEVDAMTLYTADYCREHYLDEKVDIDYINSLAQRVRDGSIAVERAMRSDLEGREEPL